MAAEAYSKPAGVPYVRASQFDHLSIHQPDEDALLRLRDPLFADADPVPAVRELRSSVRLDHTVATKLADGIIEDIYPSAP